MAPRADDTGRVRTRPRRRAESLGVAALAVAAAGGVFVAVYRDVKPEPEAAAPLSAGEARRLVEEARRAFEEQRLADARQVLAELEGAMDGSLPEEAALLARNLEIQESRTRRGAAQLEQVEEALARDDVAGALAAAERLSREFGDLPALVEEALDLLEAARRDAPEHFARYEGTLVERLRVVEVEPRVEELLDAGRVSSALDLVAGLRAASPREEEAKARLLRRIDEHARATGEPVQERVRELWEEGRLMVALHMLNDESLEALRGTGIWFELMEMAEDLEDQIDAQVPAELRPIPRRRHLPAGKREESAKDAAPEEGESSGL